MADDHFPSCLITPSHRAIVSALEAGSDGLLRTPWNQLASFPRSVICEQLQTYFRDCAVLHGLEDPEGDFHSVFRSSCEFVLDPIQRRMVAVLHLDPIRRAAAAVGAIASLGDDAL